MGTSLYSLIYIRANTIWGERAKRWRTVLALGNIGDVRTSLWERRRDAPPWLDSLDCRRSSVHVGATGARGCRTVNATATEVLSASLAILIPGRFRNQHAALQRLNAGPSRAHPIIGGDSGPRQRRTKRNVSRKGNVLALTARCAHARRFMPGGLDHDQ